MIIPYLGTIRWIETLNLTFTINWEPWFVNGQVAGLVFIQQSVSSSSSSSFLLFFSQFFAKCMHAFDPNLITSFLSDFVRYMMESDHKKGSLTFVTVKVKWKSFLVSLIIFFYLDFYFRRPMMSDWLNMFCSFTWALCFVVFLLLLLKCASHFSGSGTHSSGEQAQGMFSHGWSVVCLLPTLGPIYLTVKFEDYRESSNSL